MMLISVANILLSCNI